MSENPFRATASLIAAFLLLLREFLPGWGGLPRTVAETLALTGAGKSQAYAMRDRLREMLPTLIGTPGRPASQPTHSCDECSHCGNCSQCPMMNVLMAVRNYIVANPGSACGPGERCVYSDDFRRFVVGLVAPGRPGEGMSTAHLASATGVPLGTLKDWFRPEPPDVDAPPPPGGSPPSDGASPPPGGSPPSDDASPPSGGSPPSDGAPTSMTPADTGSATPATLGENTDPPVSSTIGSAQAQTISSIWLSWKGSFQAFCQMLRGEYRLKCGDTYIGNLLQSIGLRERKKQTPVEAPWSSNTFRLFFPGAQWLGDGTSLAVHWGDQIFVFNLEALHDPASDALVGFHVSDSEDEEALRFAYKAGLETTGSPPLSVSLDNKPCNHSPEAKAALGDTIVLRSTSGRGQAKAPLEGHFGLFQQAMPPLNITGQTPKEMARCALELVLTAWSRGRHGKPRRKLKGLTPAETYTRSKPTPEETKEALDWIHELQRRQERARATREARSDPVRLQLLTQGLAKLNIPDPDRRLAVALARYAPEAIADGLATFRSKLDLDTIPPDADHGRYLGGIIRNINTRMELERTSGYLLEQRIRLHDLTLAPLEGAAHRLRSELSPLDLPQAFTDRALKAECLIDFRFWAEAAAKGVLALPPDQRAELYKPLCRRIAASFKTYRERRADLISRLAEAVATAA